MNGFLEAFLPNLAATILGIVLGLPVALYLNKRLAAAQLSEQAAAEVVLRNQVIEILNSACAYNIKVLNKMAESALTTNVLRNPDLKTTTWDSVGSILAARCPDPALVDQLAHHWLRLQRVEQLNEDVFEMTLGISPQFDDLEMRIGIWQELHDSCSVLAIHANEFSERLVKLKSGEGPIT